MLRRLTARAILALGGILLALVALELGSRVAFPEWAPTRTARDYWTHDPLFGWRNSPGVVEGSMQHIDFEISISTNSRGLRDVEYPLERVPGKRRIVLLGDSFGWGFGVEREESFGELIEARHPDLEVINGSVSGWATDQQYLWFREEGIEYRPDVVLLLVYHNDFTDNVRTFGGHKPRFRLDDEGELVLEGTPVAPPDLSDHLRLAISRRTYFLRQLYAWLVPSRTEDELRESGPADAVERMERSSRVTRALLLEIDALAQGIGARFVVVSAPMAEGLRIYLRGVLEPAGIPYLPLEEAFEPVEEPVRFEHDFHWNELGHRVAADAVEAFLVELGILGADR